MIETLQEFSDTKIHSTPREKQGHWTSLEPDLAFMSALHELRRHKSAPGRQQHPPSQAPWLPTLEQSLCVCVQASPG